MHYKSPSYGSEPCLYRKSSYGPSLYDSNKSTMNTSVTSSHIRQDSAPALYDFIPTSTFSLSNVFPSNMINMKKANPKEKSPQRKSAENTMRPGIGFSQAIMSLENSFVYALNRKKSTAEFFKSNKLDYIVPEVNQTTVIGNTKLRLAKKYADELDIKKAIIVSAAKRNTQAMKDIEKELRKKELIIQIYEKLVEICKKQVTAESPMDRKVRVFDRRRTKSNANSNSGSPENISLENPKNKSMENNKKTKLIITGESLIRHNSLYNILVQSTLNKTVESEKLDSIQNMKTEEYLGNRDESEYPLVVLLKKSLSKKQLEGDSLLVVGNRVRKVSSVQRKRKAFKIHQDKFISSNANRRSSSLVINKERRSNGRSNISGNFYIGGVSIDQTTLSVYTSNNNSRTMKNNNNLEDMTQKFENVCSGYQKANQSLIQKIEILKRKINQLQISKKNTAT